jgi:ketosteroid isomerase-like protein
MAQSSDVVELYLEALAAGDEESVLACLNRDVVHVEQPNAFRRKGDRRGRDALTSDMARGRRLLASQRYHITSSLVDGERGAVQMEWEGVLAVAFGPFSAGDRVELASAMFFELRDGLVLSQQNYDCLPPLGSA